MANGCKCCVGDGWGVVLSICKGLAMHISICLHLSAIFYTVARYMLFRETNMTLLSPFGNNIASPRLNINQLTVHWRPRKFSLVISFSLFFPPTWICLAQCNDSLVSPRKWDHLLSETRLLNIEDKHKHSVIISLLGESTSCLATPLCHYSSPNQECLLTHSRLRSDYHRNRCSHLCLLSTRKT